MLRVGGAWSIYSRLQVLKINFAQKADTAEVVTKSCGNEACDVTVKYKEPRGGLCL